MNKNAVKMIGFWSALLAFIFSNTFTVGAVVGGMLPIALVIATLYAAITSIVYLIWLFVLEPHVMQGTESSIQAFAFGPGTFLQMLDGMAYFYSWLLFLLHRYLQTKEWYRIFAQITIPIVNIFLARKMPGGIKLRYEELTLGKDRVNL